MIFIYHIAIAAGHETARHAQVVDRIDEVRFTGSVGSGNHIQVGTPLNFFFEMVAKILYAKPGYTHRNGNRDAALRSCRSLPVIFAQNRGVPAIMICLN